MSDLDQLLTWISYAVWLLFTAYTVILFIVNLLTKGWLSACLRLLSTQILLPLLIPVGLSLLAAAIVFVQPAQVAVVISYISPGGMRPQPLLPGLHMIVPILEHGILYPTGWQTYTMSGKASEEIKGGDASTRTRPSDDSIRARTSDGQEIRLDVSIIFRINFEQVVTLHTDWQNRYIEDFVRPVIRGIVRTQVSQFKVKEVNSSARKDLESTLERLLSAEFVAKGLLVDQLQLRDITFTPEYAAAVERKQVALEDEERSLHEAQQMRNLAEGSRDQAKLIAQGEAEATLIRAEAQSQALEKIGLVLAQTPSLITYEYVQKLSPNIQAMLLPSNAPLYLPVPDLMNLSPKASLTTTLDANGSSVLDGLSTTLTNTVSPQGPTQLVQPSSSMVPTSSVTIEK